jgi:anti-sigma-K factor RskA
VLTRLKSILIGSCGVLTFSRFVITDRNAEQEDCTCVLILRSDKTSARACNSGVDSMTCEGLAAESYDLYVAGSAGEDVRREIDAHLDQNCPACLRGVKRSLALWTAYAGSMETVDPSTGLRSRLISLASVTGRMRAFRTRPPRPGYGLYGVLAASVAVLVGLGAWYAGVQYANLRGQQVVSELSDAQQSATELRAKLDAEILRRQQLEIERKKAGEPDAAGQLLAARQQVVRLQAEVNQYQDVIDRERRAMGDNLRLVTLLSSSGLRMIALHGQEAASGTVAYSFVLEGKKLVLLAYRLPKPPTGKEYQLWLVRKADPKVVSGGTFNPEDSDRAIVEFSNDQLVSELAAVAVTAEPLGGSEGPTGPKLLAGSPDTN